MAMRRLYWSVFSVPACFLARYSWARICGGRGKRGVRGSRGSAERTEKPVERTREGSDFARNLTSSKVALSFQLPTLHLPP